MNGRPICSSRSGVGKAHAGEWERLESSGCLAPASVGLRRLLTTTVPNLPAPSLSPSLTGEPSSRMRGLQGGLLGQGTWPEPACFRHFRDSEESGVGLSSYPHPSPMCPNPTGDKTSCPVSWQTKARVQAGPAHRGDYPVKRPVTQGHKDSPGKFILRVSTCHT